MLLLQILGQCLNTVVQTLVAGAFVEYMPMTIFWLGAVVTGEHITGLIMRRHEAAEAPSCS
jgi:hypothetical protein